MERFPYQAHEEQLKAMQAIRAGLHHGGVTIIESPTGTGKTLMLLTACLDFMHSGGGDGGGEPEWIRKHRAMMAADQDEGVRWRKRRRRHEDNTTGSSVHKLLSLLPSSESDGEETVSDVLNNTINPHTTTFKLVYASRTHSQLRQVLGELEKVNREGLKAIILGGRSQLCINQSINNNNTGDLADKCADLVASDHGCPYWHQQQSVGNVKELIARMQQLAVIDIEESVRVGRECRACPYYTVRAMQRSASIILCPYSLLFTQQDGGIKLDKNTIVVIDEAHNLQDFINQQETKVITKKRLGRCLDALQRYASKYGKRMSGLNLSNLQQLLFVVGNINKFMDGVVGSEQGESLGVLQFMQTCSIDTINLPRLTEYTKTARLAHKLDHQDTNDHHLLFEVIGFVEKLSEQSDNGRILSIPDTNDVLCKYVNVRASTVMEPIVTNSRAVVLAGGTMSPLSDMIDGLFPTTAVHHHSFKHVLSEDRFAVSLLGCGPANCPIDCRLERRGNQKMWSDINTVLLNFSRITPGSMCVFFASFPLLQQALSQMDVDLLRATRPLFVEERERGAAGVDALLKAYTDTPKSCLFAVIGGRLSEGVNLRDDHCRTMIVVGLPYLNERDVEVAERVRYGGGSRYLHNQCMRKVNQTIGRALRHARDYAYILLLDARYEAVSRDLPHWMQPSIRVCANFPAAYSRAVQFFKKQFVGDGGGLVGAVVEGRGDAVGPR